MASPQSTTSAAGGTQNKNEQITFRFCSECSNMLYPKEDEDSHKLQFTCRTCQYTEEASSTCVFRNFMNNAAGETAGVTQDVASDPTVRTPLSLSHFAPQAGLPRDTTNFSNPPANPASEDKSHELALCFKCGTPLLLCGICDDPASVEEYNEFVSSNSNFQVQRAMDLVHAAWVYKHLPPEQKRAWEESFASPEPLPMPSITSSLGSWSDSDGLTPFLGLEIAMNPEADPPEALGVEEELNENPMWFS